MTFCGCRAQFGDGTALTKLPTQRPTFFVQSNPPHISRDDFISACMTAFGRWSMVCDVIFAPTNDQQSAQFVIFTHQFDGPSGILADCELPGPAQQSMRLDPTERWTIDDGPAPGQIDLLRVMCHEMGHGIGLQHFDPNVPPPELMNPKYADTIISPQSGEITMVQRLYGMPKTIQPPTPVTPIGDSVDLQVVLKNTIDLHAIISKTSAGYGLDVQFGTSDGKHWQAKGNAHQVTG